MLVGRSTPCFSRKGARAHTYTHAPYVLRHGSAYLRCGVVHSGSSLELSVAAMRCQRRFFPGKVDFILNSHQIMHICTLVATWTVFRAMSEDYVCYRSTA